MQFKICLLSSKEMACLRGERGEQNAIERDEDRKWESSVRANEGSCANSSAI